MQDFFYPGKHNFFNYVQGKYNMAKFHLDTFLCNVIIHYNSQVQGQVGFIFSSHILVSVLYQLYIVTIF